VNERQAAYVDALGAALAVPPGRRVVVVELVCDACTGQPRIAGVSRLPNGALLFEAEIPIQLINMQLQKTLRDAVGDEYAYKKRWTKTLVAVLLDWHIDDRVGLKRFPAATCDKCRGAPAIDEARLMREVRAASQSGRKWRVPLRRVAYDTL
jgi:hypothetical protein